MCVLFFIYIMHTITLTHILLEHMQNQIEIKAYLDLLISHCLCNLSDRLQVIGSDTTVSQDSTLGSAY